MAFVKLTEESKKLLNSIDKPKVVQKKKIKRTKKTRKPRKKSRKSTKKSVKKLPKNWKKIWFAL